MESVILEKHFSLMKETKLYSVLYQKCPNCYKGNMFKHGPFSLRFADMHKNCPKCKFDFIQEPSFYFGAMYVSYAIQVAMFVMVYLVLRYTINPDTWTYVIWMVVGVVAILPLNFRWSRVAWLSMFTRSRY